MRGRRRVRVVRAARIDAQAHTGTGMHAKTFAETQKPAQPRISSISLKMRRFPRTPLSLTHALAHSLAHNHASVQLLALSKRFCLARAAVSMR